MRDDWSGIEPIDKLSTCGNMDDAIEQQMVARRFVVVTRLAGDTACDELVALVHLCSAPTPKFEIDGIDFLLMISMNRIRTINDC
jgi:hypothetical protein